MKKSKKIIALLAIVLVFLSIVAYHGSKSLLKTLYPCEYSDIVESNAKDNNLSPWFVYAVIKCESDFVSDAVSHTGAVGLMQIMPDTFTWISGKLGEENNFDKASQPGVNIKYGCYLYGYLMEKYQNEETAVAAYHAGIGSVNKWLKDESYSSDGKTLHTIPFPTTAKYVKKVIETKNIYEKLYT